MFTTRRLFTGVALFASAAISLGALSAQDETFTLTVLHTNDEHSYHETNAAGNGGVARLATVLEQVRAESENFLLLDAGDRFTGTLFHQQWRGEDNLRIMNALGYDAMTLGNHEFDDGDEELAAFISGLNFPVVSANITVAEDGPLAGLFTPSTILDVNGEQIGVIGITTADTANIASPGEGTEFSAEYATIVNEAASQLSEQGVNKIILLSHIGYTLDVELAPQLADVDVIIGGHSHTLLSNTYAAAEAPYPFEAETATGQPIYVVQAGGGSSVYAGLFEITFDADGVATDFGGDTIMLSRYITPNADVQAIVDELNEPLELLRNTVVGSTQVFLVGDRAFCRAQECTLGNLITDALRAETGAQIAITNGGGIRSNIPVADTPDDVQFNDAEPVTLGEVLTVLPFGNLTSTFSLSGADLIAAIEHGVGAVEDGAGRFPQVSGIRYTFDPAAAVGERVSLVEVQGEDGEYTEIDPEAIYTVASNDFMRQGGDGYTVFAENAIDPYDFGKPLDQVLAEYIEANSPVAPELEGRIIIAG